MHGEVGVVLVGGRAGEIKITKKDPGSIRWGGQGAEFRKEVCFICRGCINICDVQGGSIEIKGESNREGVGCPGDRDEGDWIPSGDHAAGGTY